MGKNILAIIGSASSGSANLKLIKVLEEIKQSELNFTIYDDLKTLPHFDPEVSAKNPPNKIVDLRNLIQNSDGIIICTPEYVFSIPSGLKNAIEWCIITTVFMNKPCWLITASSSGLKGHEELQLIMKTAMAHFTDETTLLIQGIKSKFDEHGNLIDIKTQDKLKSFIDSFMKLVMEKQSC